MTDFGSDISTFPVTDMTGRTISGPRVVLECLLRRYTTPNGFLEYDPEFGFDLRYLLNGDFTAADLRQIQAGATREALKDERIAAATVVISLDSSTSTMRIRVSGVLSDRTSFAGVLAIDQVSAAVLEAN